MDSANSGSMQSSDEEYESRGESFTSFLNPSGGGGGLFGSLANHHNNQQPPLLPPQQYQFNQNSQNLEAAFAQSSNANSTQYGNDDVWSRGLRSQNNHHPNFENFVPLSSSSSSSSNQSLFGAASQLLINQQPPQFATSSSSSTMTLGPLQSQSLEGNPPRGGGGGGGAGSNQNNDHHQSTTAKNPKKRTRASRRAPTTVLNTDTSNFRQMVQQFTGIPAAPFSSSPYSRRLDLFSGSGGGGGGMMGIRSGNLDPLYPLRPSAQKLQMSPFLAQSSSNLLTSTMLEALVSATNQSTTSTTTNTAPDNLLSIHNQILSFQQQQQQQPTSLKSSPPILGTKSVTATTANANGTSSSANNNNNLRSTTQQQQGVPVVTSFDELGLNHEIVNENINQQLGSNYQFHSDKGLENVQSSSGEGTIGQWVCSDH